MSEAGLIAHHLAQATSAQSAYICLCPYIRVYRPKGKGTKSSWCTALVGLDPVTLSECRSPFDCAQGRVAGHIRV